MKRPCFFLLVLLVPAVAPAQDFLFGEPGSGRPTKTVVGILGGAAAGAAIGQAVDPGGDGWWIGALSGSVLGGGAGSAWGASDRRRGYWRDRRSCGWEDGYVVVDDGWGGGWREDCIGSSWDFVERWPQETVVLVEEPPRPSPREIRAAMQQISAEAVWPVTPAVEKAAGNETLPSGWMTPTGKIRSPWSRFEMDAELAKPGETVHDALTGRRFVVP